MVAIVSGSSLGLSLTSSATLGQRGTLGFAGLGRGGEQAYVNAATGNLVLQRQDDFLAGLGQGLNVVRTYNSAGKLNDDNADNWSIGVYNQPLVLTGTLNTAGSTITRTGADGAESVYVFDTLRQLYVSTDGAGAHDTIAWDAGNSLYVWTEGSSGMQERYEGNAAARLISRTDANGNTTSFSYTPAGLLESVTTASGETTYYDYTGNQLQQVRVVAQGGVTATRVHYSYDTSGRLSGVTVDLSPQDNSIATGATYQTTYTYDGASNRVASVTQSDGTRLDITYVLVGSDYRVASIGDALGQVTTYSYDTAGRRTTVTDPLGVASRYSYNVKGELTQVQAGITAAKPLGLSQLYYGYDTDGNVTAITDGLGHTIALQYDTSGNQTLKVDALGNTVTSTYDSRNQLLTETITGNTGTATSLSQSITSRFVYDAAGKRQLRFSVSAEGRVTEYRYDAFGQRTSSIEYGAAVYDLSGLASTAAPTEAQLAAWAAVQNLSGGQRTDYAYDFRGQLSTRTVYDTLDAAGNGSGAAVTTYVYSQAGELLQTIAPLGGTTTHVYDGLGRVIASTAPSSDGVTPNLTTTTYNDALGQMTVTLVNGLSTVSVYDAAGRLVSVMQSSAGTGLGTTLYTYDQDGRLVMTQDPTGVRRRMVYDDAGRKVADIDGTGAVTEYVYNANDQLTQTIAYAQKVSTASAPTMAQIHALSHADDRKAWRIYDSAQRLVWQVDALGYVTQTDYDSAGRIVQVTNLATPVNTSLLGDATQVVVAGGALTPAGVPVLAASVVSVQVSNANPALGVPVTLTALVLGDNPAGTVTFYSGATVLGTANLLNGMASLVVGNLPAGVNSIRAEYAGNASNAASASAVVTATVQNTAGVTVSAPAQPVAQGETVVLTATVSGSTPGGTVTFFDGSAAVGSATVQIVGGVAKAVLHTSTLGSGSHAITAVYSGDALNTGAAAATPANVQVSGASAVALASSAVQATVGTSVSLTATVNTPGGQPQATGNVSFYQGNTLLGTVALVNGVALFNTSALAVGVHSLKAVYEGDTGTAASSSATLGQAIVPVGATTVVLTPSNVQLASGGSLTLNASVAAVASGGPALTGSIAFYDGVTLLGTVNVANGAASLVVNGVTTGSHAYKAVYSGDTLDAGSTSANAAVVAVVGGPAIGSPGAMSSPVALAASQGSIVQGGSVTLTATVTGTNPSGTVTFVSGGTVLGTANVVAGVATLVVSSLAIGSHAIQATYSGDVGNPGGVSGAAAVNVAPAATSFGVTSSMPTAVKNTPVVLTAQLTGGNAALLPTGNVSFYSGATLLGTVALVNGIAALSVGTLDVGANNITVQYAGDANNAAGTSAVVVQTITPAPAAISLAASSNSIQAGASITLTANLATTVTGTVTFFNGFTSLGTVNIVNGVASLTTSALTAGNASITAVYSGDVANASSASAVSAVAVAAGAGASVVTTTISPSGPITAGAPVTLGAQISNGSNISLRGVSEAGGVYTKSAAGEGYNASVRGTVGVVGGVSVSFTAPSTSTGSAVYVGLNTDAATDDSSASIDWALCAYQGTLVIYQNGSFYANGGAYAAGDVLSVEYTGSAVRYLKNGAVLYQQAATINQPLYLDSSFYSTGVQIANLQLKNGAGEVVPLLSGAAPTGTVSFYNGEASLGTANVVNGVASLSTSLPTAGTANIRAVYNGDAGNAAAVSASTAVVVNSTVQLNASSTSVTAGAPLTLTADVGIPQQLSIPYPVVFVGPNGFYNAGDSSNSVSGQVGYSGGMSVSFKPGAMSWGNTASMGLTTNSGSGSYYISFQYNNAYIYHNGAFAGSLGNQTGTEEFSVVYTGSHVQYRKNGVVVAELAATITQPLYVTGGVSGMYNGIHDIKIKNAAGQLMPVNFAPTATGTVTFYSGQTKLGTADLVNGRAQLQNPLLASGTANITAVYSGDATNAAAVSASTAITVNPTVALSASSTSITAGSPVTLTANLGNVNTMQNSTVLTGVSLSNGTVTKTATTNAWDSSIRSTAGFTGGAVVSFTVPQVSPMLAVVGLNTDPSFNDGYYTVDYGLYFTSNSLNFSENGTTTSLGNYAAGDSFRIEYDGARVKVYRNTTVLVDFAATITQPLYLDSSFVYPGSTISNLDFKRFGASATGTVSFFDGQTLLGTANVVNGSASLATGALAVNGTASITAVYNGDALNNVASSSSLAIAVSGGTGSPGATPSTSVSLSPVTAPGGVVAGQPVTLTASIGNGLDVTIATRNLSISGGTFTKNAGTNSLYDSTVRSLVGYTGGASVSFVPQQTSKYAHVGLNTDPALNDDYTNLDWALQIGPSGVLNVYQNGSLIANVGSYAVGDVLSVEYNGTHIRYLKNGVVLRQEAATITQPLYLDSCFYETGTQISNLQFKNGAGTAVTLNAGGTYTGSVTFFDGEISLGTANLVNGAASLTTSALAVGTASLRAVYNGDAGNPAAISANTALVVNSAVQLSASSASVTAGAPLTLTADIGIPQQVSAGANMTVSGSGITNSLDNQWNQLVGMVGYTGGASVTFSAGTTTQGYGSPSRASVMGLTTDPGASGTHSSIDYALYFNSNIAYVYQNGAMVTSLDSYSVYDEFSISYEAGYVRYWKNGAVVYQQAATITQPLYLDARFGGYVSVSNVKLRDAAGQVRPLNAAPTATGKVSFYDGQKLLGVAELLNGRATLTTTSLGAGTASIRASYSGDSTNAGAISAATPVVVNPAISLSSSSGNVNSGSPVTLTATLPNVNTLQSLTSTIGTGGLTITGNTITKTSGIYGGDAYINSTAGFQGGAEVSFTVPQTSPMYAYVGLSTGVHNYQFILQNNSGVAYGYGIDHSQTGFTYAAGDTFKVTYDGTYFAYYKNGSLMYSTPIAVSNALTFAAGLLSVGTTLSNVKFGKLGSSANPTSGTVSFYDGQTLLGTSSVVNGSASLATTALTTNGTKSITAIYGGDSFNDGAISASLPILVSGATSGAAATTTMLSASPASITRAESTLLTATIAGGANGVTPTGSVMFYNGATFLGTSVLVNGQATFTATGLPVGANNLRAVYTGDAQAAGSASSIFAETVTKTAASAVVSTSVTSRNTSTANVTLVARLSGTSPSGTVTFYNNGVAIGSAVNVVNGIATLSTSLPLGSTSITAQYSGDTNNTTATSAGVALSTRAPSTITVAAPTPATIAYGAEVTLSATAYYNAASPGTVAFYSGATLLGVATVQSNGVATLVTRTIPVGTAPITAAYSGNVDHDPVSAASAQSVTVTGSSTQTALAVSRSLTPYGTTVFLNATVTANGWTSGIGGTVTFYNGATVLGIASVTNGVAQLAASGLEVGANQITAVYNGSAGYGASMSGASGAAVSTAPANVALTTSAATVALGSPVTLTAQVTGANPGGIVTFTHGATVLGTAAVIGGVATLVVSSLPAGGNQLQASYGGDTHNGAAASAAVLQTVSLPASGSLSLTSPNPVAQAGNIVIAVAGSTPGGTVTLLNGSTVVGTATVVGGVATISARQLPAGALNLTAVYSGDAANGPSQLQFAQTVTPSLAASSVALAATPVLTADGYGVKLMARVDGMNPGGSVTFYRGGVAVGTVALTYGMASIELNTPLTGADTFHAVYAGDAANEGSSSAAVAPSTGSPVLSVSYSTQDRAVHEVYDNDGLLRGMVDGEGYFTEYQYNASGQLFKTIRYYQPVSGFTGAASIAARLATARQAGVLDGLRPAADARDAYTACFYDARGQKTGELDAEGYLTQYTHDTNGNLTQTTRYATRITAVATKDVTAATLWVDLGATSAAADKTSTATYDALNRLTQQTNPEGTVTQYSYDSVGNLVKTVQAASTVEARSLETRYDVQGRLVGELSAQGAALLTGSQTPAEVDAIWAQYGVSHSYDAAGRRIATTDQNGNRTLFFYDDQGRVTHSVNALGEVTEHRYNAHGQISDEVRYGTRISLTGLTGGLVSGSTLLAAVDAVKDAAKDTTQTYTYNTRGGLATATDALGNTTTFAYNAFGEESTRTQPALGAQVAVKTAEYDRRGLQVTSTLDAGGINAVTQAIYDAFGRLSSSQDANGNIRTQTYDRLGRMISATDPQTPARTSSYDAFGRVLTQTDALGKTTTYAYDDATRSVVVTTPEGITVSTVQTRLGQTQSVTDGLGTTTSYAYDKNGSLLSTTTPLTTTSSAYDRAGRLVETTDANGNKVELAYDAANRVLSRTVDPLGLAIRTEYTYDAKGQQISVKDPNGTTTQMVFDLKGQLKQQIVDPTGLNLVTAYDYDKRGNVVSVTDPNGTLTTYTFDKLGRRTQEVLDPTGLNLRKSYEYDKNGNVTRSVDGNSQATRYTYDANDRLVFTLDATGAVQESIYDAEGRTVTTHRYGRQIDVSGLGNALTDSDIRARLLTATTQSPDAVQHFFYDDDGRVKATMDGAGALVTYKRDGLGHVVEQTAYVDKIAGAVTPGTVPTPAWGADSIRTYTVYDQLGRARYSVDGTGAVISQRYDANGNVIERVAHVNRLSLDVQPLSANPTEAELASRIAFLVNDAQDGYSRYAYDKANRLVLQADGVGAVTQYRYDANGNLLQSVKHATAITVGQLRQANVPAPAGTADDRVTRQVYDKANRVVLSVDAAGAASRYDYDRNGNVVKSTQFARSLGSTYLSQVAAAGSQLVSVYQPLPDANDRIGRHVYDAANRQDFAIDAEGAVTEFRHDGASNLVYTRQYKVALNGTQLAQIDSIATTNGHATRNDMVARLTTTPSEDRITRQYFDAAGNLRFTRDANLNLKEFRYDGVGRMTSTTVFMTAQAGDTYAETYSQAGQLLPLPTATWDINLTDQTSHFDYDAAGNLEISTDAEGKTEVFQYDALGRKTVFANKLGNEWHYVYDDAGHLTRETSPPVPLTVMEGNAPSTTNASVVTEMTYDGRGNLLSRTEGVGRSEARTIQYQYDALGRQVKTVYPPVGVYMTELDAALANNGASGAAVRMDAQQSLSTETFYDALGNAFASRNMAGDWSYKTYDHAGRVLHDIDAEGHVTGYTHNAFGQADRLVRYAGKLSMPASMATPKAAQVQAAVDAFDSHAQDRALLTAYDRNGRVSSVTESAVYSYQSTFAPAAGVQGSGSSISKTTQNVYDAFGDLTRIDELRAPGSWASTSFYYDRLGRQTHIVDALNYLTVQEFDAAGNMTERTEYATASTFNAGTGRPVAATSAQDRKVRYSYDALNRKRVEDRVNVQYVEASSVSTTSAATHIVGLIRTTYAYDAVGNLTYTRDASAYDSAGNLKNPSDLHAGVTYSYYDALGRVTAVMSPHRAIVQPNGATIDAAPVTEFRRDALGNVLATVERASGTTGMGAATYEPPSIAGADRVTVALYDKLGRVTQATDANSHSRFNSYDAMGNLRKTWETVTIAGGGTQTLFTAYEYDKAGRQVATVQPLDTTSATGVARTTANFNAFGEVTTRSTSGLTGSEFYDYDNAGRVWRTNAGDGVTKVFVYDVRGNKTVEIVSPSVDLKLFNDAQTVLAASNQAPTVYRRTDIVYDALGRVTDTVAATRVHDVEQPITMTRSEVTAIRVSSADYGSSGVTSAGVNQVNLQLPPLDQLGAGDLRIELVYTSKATQHYVAGEPQPAPAVAGRVVSRVISAEEGQLGYSMQWTDNQTDALNGIVGISRVEQVRLYKKDLLGNWQQLFAGATNETGEAVTIRSGDFNVDVGYPADIVSSTYVEWRLVVPGQSEEGGWVTNGLTQMGFGKAHRFHAVAPSDGTFEYRVRSVGRDGIMHTIGLGTFQIGAPMTQPPGISNLPAVNPNVRIVEDIIDGNRHEVLRWDAPPPGTTVSIQRRVANTTTWLSPPQMIFYAGDGRSETPAGAQEAAIDVDGSGTYEYEIFFHYPPNGLMPARTGHAVGKYTVTVPPGTVNNNTTPAAAPRIDGVNMTVANIDGTLYHVIRWPQPVQANTTVEFMYRPAGGGGAWTTRTPGDGIYTSGYSITLPAGQQGTPLNLPVGDYEFKLVFTNQGTGAVQRNEGTFRVPLPPSETDATAYQYTADFANEGITGYTFTTPGPGRVPLYRWYQRDSLRHFYLVRDDAEAIAWLQNANYQYDGTVGYVATYQAPGTTPLYRLNFPWTDKHLYTTDWNEVAYAQASGWQYEWVECYVATAPSVETSALYRLYRYSNEDHFYTNSSPERSWLLNTIYAPPTAPLTPPNTALFSGVDIGTGTVGGVAKRVLGWPPVEAGAVLTLTRTDAAGNTSTPQIYTAGVNGTQLSNAMGQAVVVEGAPGVYIYQFIVQYPANGSHGAFEARSTIQVTIPANGSELPTWQDVTALPVPNVRTGPDVIDGNMHDVLVWDRPPAGTTTQLRMRAQGTTAWSGNVTIYTGLEGRSSPLPGSDEAAIDIFGPGTFEYELVLTAPDGTQKRSTGFFTIYARSANAPTVTTVPYGGPIENYVTQGPVSGTRPRVHQTTDRWGNVLEVNDARMTWESGSWRTTYQYNASNQLIEESRPQDMTEGNAITRVFYDKLGRQVAVQDPRDNIPGRVIVNVQEYDAGGNLLVERHADGGRVDYGYDAFGNKVLSRTKVTDDHDVVKEFTYDNVNRLLSSKLQGVGVAVGRVTVTANAQGDYKGQFAPIDPLSGLTVDGANGVTMEAIKYENLIEQNVYDEAGRKVYAIRGGTVPTDSRPGTVREFERYQYDRRGNVIESGHGLADQLENVVQKTAYTYDAANRKISETDANNHTQTWTYNYFGWITDRVDFTLNPATGASGLVDYSFTYDFAGQLTHQGSSTAEHPVYQNLNYTYDGAGQLIRINDDYLGQVTRYTYDLGGRKLSEVMTQKTAVAWDPETEEPEIVDAIYQSNRMAYDSLGRLRLAADGNASVQMTYDKAGNRTGTTTVMNGVTQTDLTYGYDAMNRQISGQNSTYTYDYAGNRVTERVGGDPLKETKFTYDDMGRVTQVKYNDQLQQEFLYDGAGRNILTRTVTDRGNNLKGLESRYNVYNAVTGNLSLTHVYQRAGATGQGEAIMIDTVEYERNAPGMGYDAAGNLLGTWRRTRTTPYASDEPKTYETKYRYTHDGGYKVAEIGLWQDLGNWDITSGITHNYYDANGYLSNVVRDNGPNNKAMVNDAQGRAVYINEGAADGPGAGRILNVGTYQGGVIGTLQQPGHIQRQMIVNGEALARYGEVSNSTPHLNQQNTYRTEANLLLGASPQGNTGSGTSGPASYTVVGNENLRDIARSVLGDAGLWYTIAEANGLAGDGDLIAGRTLVIPQREISANNHNTFRPYDAAAAIGDLSPAMPMPQFDKGCGAMGQLVMVIVAVVATIFTAGALSGITGGLLTTMQAGVGVLSGGLAGGYVGVMGAYAASAGSLGLLGTAAVAGAVGSIASQAIGVAIGAQEKFSWKGVALGAVSAGATAGLGSLAAGGGALYEIGVVGRAALASAATQGIGVATGFQKKFDWRSVAASAVGAGVGQAVGGAIGDAFGEGPFGQFANRAVSGFAAGTAAAVMRGGKVSMTQVAVDAFGNAIGSSLASSSSSGGGQPTTGDFARMDGAGYRGEPFDDGVRSGAFMQNYLRTTSGGISSEATDAEVTGYMLKQAGLDGDMMQVAGRDAIGLGFRGRTAIIGAPTTVNEMLEKALADTGALKGQYAAAEAAQAATARGLRGIEKMAEAYRAAGLSGATGDPVDFGYSAPQASFDINDPDLPGNVANVFAGIPESYGSGSIKAIEPTVWEQLVGDPNVQHVMANSITGQIVGQFANFVGRGISAFRSDGYNPATLRHVHGVEKQRALQDTVIGLATLPIGMGSTASIRAAGTSELSWAKIARRAELNAKFGRTGNLDLDINTRGAVDVRRQIDRLVAEGHAPARHGQRVTELALDNRAMYQFDPITGTTTDYFTRGQHNVGRNATKFVTDEAMLRAEAYARGSSEFATARADALANNLAGFPVKGLRLEDALGSNYAGQVFGKTRLGSINNPIGTAPIDFTDGTFTSIFRKSPSGNWNLHTMYPEPR